MKKHHAIQLLLILGLFATESRAQTGILVSPCAGTFSRNSLFFDLQATGNIVLDSIAILSQNCGTRDFKVYYKQGTYLGFNGNPAAWTLLDSTLNFTPNCALSCPIPPSVIPVRLNLCLSAGQTYGIYIAMTGGTGTIESHNLLPAGSIAVQDPNLKLITGEGHNGNTPFNTGGTIVTGLTVQGEFHYHFPFLSLGSDTTICSGDSILLNAGNAFNTFQWSNGSTTQTIFAANAGNYAVLVDSGACQASDTITVSVQSCSGITANLISSDTAFCEKKCLDFFDLSTNSPTSWLWLFPGSDSVSSTLQDPVGICYSSYGTFDVTLIACNATGCDTLFLPGFIKEFQSPPVPVISNSFDTLFSSPAYAYQWYDSSGAISGATSSYYIFQVHGSYYVIVTDSNGCASSSSVIQTAIEEAGMSGSGISVFPNPANGNVNLSFNFSGSEEIQLEMMDYLGRIVYRKYLSEQQKSIQIYSEFFSAGAYIVRVIHGKNIAHKRIIINR